MTHEWFYALALLLSLGAIKFALDKRELQFWMHATAAGVNLATAIGM